MSKFKKDYKSLSALTDTISRKLSNCSSLGELTLDVNYFVSLYKKMLTYARKKDLSSMRFMFIRLGYGCLLFDNLKDLLVEQLHLEDMNSMDIWEGYIRTMIVLHTFRVFNYDVLVKPATYYLNNNKYDEDYHEMLLSNMKYYHNYGIDDNYSFIDNTYNRELSKPIFKFLEHKLNGVVLRISDEEKKAYKDELSKKVFSYFNTKYVPNITIRIDEKTKFKLPKKYPNYVVFHMDLLEKDLNKDNYLVEHEDTVGRLIANPNPINLYFYLLEVLAGYEHYNYLNNLIIDILENVKVGFYNVSSNLFGDNLFVNVISKYFMMYFGIVYPKNQIKAMEYLSMNMSVLINYAEYTSIFMKYLPYDLHTIIVNNPTNSDEFNCKCLNILHLNKTRLIKVLDSYCEEKQYELLKYIKDNNVYIFNEIIEKYQAAYDKGLEIDRQKELELAKQAEIERQKQLEEQEKQKKLEEEKAKKIQAEERLKANINRESKILTDEELMNLINKTDDIHAMYAVAKHYFKLGSTDYRNYKLSYHYYKIIGELGDSTGYFNAAVSINNYNIRVEENSEEYKNNHNLIMEMLGKTKLSSYYYFAYAFYAHDFKKPEYTEFIEKNYTELINRPNINEESISLIKSGYYFYKDDYVNCIIYFDKVKEYVDSALLSMFANRYYHKVYEYTQKIKAPKVTDDFINPFSKEYAEFNRAQAIYLDSTMAVAKTNRIINWAAELGDRTSIKYKAYCLYYGIMNFKKDHKQAYEILANCEHTFTINDSTYAKIFEELKKEFGGKKRK